MNKKKTKAGCLIFILCTLLFFSSPTKADPSLYISEYSLTPEIFQPGDQGILTVTITNGETTATITDTDYINSLPMDQTTKTLGAIIENIYLSTDGDGTHTIYAIENYPDPVELAPGASITLAFTLKAQDNIKEGIYTPLVHIELESDDYTDVSFPILVKISNESIDLIEHQVPSTISSIGATDVTFNLLNHRQNSISDIIITPEQNQYFDISPTKQHIQTISGIDSSTVMFSIIPKSTGEYNLPISCQYKNGDNIHTEIFTFPVTIEEFHEVYPIMYSSPEMINKGETKEIRLKLYNAKNEGITGVRITPQTEAKITPNEYFIGSMDADDLYAVTFEITVDELSVNTTYPISYEITFKQDSNIYSTTPVTTSFTVTSSNGQNGTEYIIGFGIVVLIIFFIFIFYMYRKKRR